MKKAITIIAIAVFLLTIGSIEEAYIQSTTKKLFDYSNELYLSIEADEENIDREENMILFHRLKNFWIKAESKMCLIENYENIKNITESIAKLETSLEEKDLSVTYENITLLKYASKILKNVLGFSFQNVI